MKRTATAKRLTGKTIYDGFSSANSYPYGYYGDNPDYLGLAKVIFTGKRARIMASPPTYCREILCGTLITWVVQKKFANKDTCLLINQGQVTTAIVTRIKNKLSKLNMLEDKYGWERTECFTLVDKDGDLEDDLLFVGSNNWRASSEYLSLYTLILRTFVLDALGGVRTAEIKSMRFDEEDEDIQEAWKDKPKNVKLGLVEFMIKNKDKITKGVNVKEYYSHHYRPTSVTEGLYVNVVSAINILKITNSFSKKSRNIILRHYLNAIIALTAAENDDLGALPLSNYARRRVAYDVDEFIQENKRKPNKSKRFGYLYDIRTRTVYNIIQAMLG